MLFMTVLSMHHTRASEAPLSRGPTAAALLELFPIPSLAHSLESQSNRTPVKDIRIQKMAWLFINGYSELVILEENSPYIYIYMPL